MKIDITERADNVVERNILTKVVVSTVKLIVPSFTHNQDYETIVFSINEDQQITSLEPLAEDSYDTEEEAKIGHANMMETWVMKDRD